MGDDQRQSGLDTVIFFLDENHCRNPHVIMAIEESGFRCEKHLDHFPAGIEDVDWLPIIARYDWSLITSDARIRSNFLEKKAVCENGVRMFYFSKNNLAGREMGLSLRRALPKMRRLIETQPPPFTASISKTGEVTLRDTF